MNNMTTKSKTFYVNQKAIVFLSDSYTHYFGAIKIASFKNDDHAHEITVSWKEDRTAQVSESQMREILKGYGPISRNEIINAIFNNKE